MKKTRRMKITKGEKLIYVLGAIISPICILIIQIFCGATIGNLNISVEKLKYEINDQAKTNESLVMQVNELTSYDKLKDIVKDMGLAYNYDSIIVIEK
jgi:Protein required for the initiation of cell division